MFETQTSCLPFVGIPLIFLYTPFPILLPFFCSSGLSLPLCILFAHTELWALSAVVVNPVVSLTNSNMDLNPPHKFLQVRSRRSQQYEPLLLENEREAVADLLQYLESMYST